MKKKLISLLSIVVLLSIAFTGCKEDDPCDSVNCQNNGVCITGVCDCPINWTGANCNTPVSPSYMKITDIRLFGFPFVNNSGGSWDPSGTSSNPDIFLTLTIGQQSSSNSSDYSGTYDNCIYGSTYSYNNLNWTCTSPGAYYTVGLWDRDISLHDFMSGFYFKPTDYSSDGNPPSKITLSSDSNPTAMELDVEWYY